MYSTCLFCHGPLGANEVLPTFPVGSRLAYDPKLGRLWVICPRCARWNLSPLEERWEALEEAERRFRDTRLRYSTGQIGLARLPAGVELVRVGAPLRQEMAAWRYGRMFGARRRRQLLTTGAGVTLVAGVALAPAMAPVLAALGGGTWSLVNAAHALYRNHQRRRVAARLAAPDGGVYELTLAHVLDASLLSDGREWRIEVEYRDPGNTLRRRASRAWDALAGRELHGPTMVSITGEDAVRAAGLILPRLNPGGGGKRRVESAVAFLERAGAPERAFAEAVRVGASRWSLAGPTRIRALPAPVRLALEMAGHEDTERLALEGELRALEAAWRDAEEIAGIADLLALPPEVEERVERERGARS